MQCIKKDWKINHLLLLWYQIDETMSFIYIISHIQGYLERVEKYFHQWRIKCSLKIFLKRKKSPHTFHGKRQSLFAIHWERSLEEMRKVQKLTGLCSICYSRDSQELEKKPFLKPKFSEIAFAQSMVSRQQDSTHMAHWIIQRK